MRDAAHQGRDEPRDDAILTLLYDTGLRRGELSQVNRDMLHLVDGQLRILGSIQKAYFTLRRDKSDMHRRTYLTLIGVGSVGTAVFR